ncbi:hypothetical protein UPYG_G00121820 [Umbra pygmaea]|uniref:T-box domain-containing protein n=1 Tax=Umbra pygmaea TaxID=75934 RepID=A0ABD0XQB3_UMBPY
MYLHEERTFFCDYTHTGNNSQTKSYAYCQPDAVLQGQLRDGISTVSGENELSAVRLQVSLQGRELWEQFGVIGTEMLITKTGRRMFPSCKVTVTGLNPLAKYVLMMDMVPFDESKYKWITDHWEVSGKTELHHPNHYFIHPDSPSLGKRWMQYPVSFHKLKLTNNTLNTNGMVVLHSMHKYQPRLHIFQSPDLHKPLLEGYLCFTFPEAAFIAVTAYQNSEITKLKIAHNPFAKGFRVNGLNRQRFTGKQFQSSKKPNERQCQMESKSTNEGSRPVESDSEDDVTVSSSVESHGASAHRMDDITSLSAAPNPFISAFMTRGAANVGQEVWGVQGPSTHHGHAHNTFNTRDYGRKPPTLSCRPVETPSPLLTHSLRGEIGPAPDRSHIYSCTSEYREQQQPQEVEFDYPLPLPPKVSRMQLPESALRSLEMMPSPFLSGRPQPLIDILNRIHGSAVHSGTPQEQLFQALYQGPELLVDSDPRPPKPYPTLPDHESQNKPLHSLKLYQQNSILGSWAH